MIETAENKDELKTVSLEKDMWILELPRQICEREGFAERTLVSLKFKKRFDSERLYQAVGRNRKLS